MKGLLGVPPIGACDTIVATIATSQRIDSECAPDVEIKRVRLALKGPHQHQGGMNKKHIHTHYTDPFASP